MKSTKQKHFLKPYLIFIFCLMFTLINIKTIKAKDITFHGGYTFSTFKGQKVAAVYITIINLSKNDISFKSLTTEVSGKAEIHNVLRDGDIMKMEKMENFLIKGSETIFFQPGGTHIMLMGLKKQLKDRESFDLIFETKKKKTYKTTVTVIDRQKQN